MRVGIDAIRAFRNATGLGNYSRHLVRLLATHVPENEYHLYSPTTSRSGLGGFLYDLPHVSVHTATGWRQRSPGRQWWRTYELGRKVAADGVVLYHGLSFEVPRDLKRTGVPSIVTVPDLIYRRHPELFGPLEQRLYHWKFKESFRVADRFIAISQQSKDDLVHYYRVPPDRIDVVYPACDPVFRQPIPADELEARLAQYGLAKGFALQVGTMEPRKNAMTLLEAYTRLSPATRPKLVLVGRRTGYTDHLESFVAEHSLEAEVTLMHDVPSEDLPAFYQGATVFVYPSLFEGFGLPILEAVVSGTPVIASTGSCFEEVGGPESLYTPPTDAGALAEALESVLTDPDLAAAMSRAGHRHAERFEDDRLAEGLRDAYRSVLA